MEYENILSIVYIVLLVLSIVSTILTLIIKNTKNTKTKENAQSVFDVVKKIQDLIIKAEEHIGYTGIDKFDYVITRAKEFMTANKYTIKEEELETLIENEITLSNNVNVKKEEKQETTTIENVSRETF